MVTVTRTGFGGKGEFKAMMEQAGEAWYGWGETSQAAINSLGANLIAMETINRQGRKSGLDPSRTTAEALAAATQDRNLIDAQKALRAFQLAEVAA